MGIRPEGETMNDMNETNEQTQHSPLPWYLDGAHVYSPRSETNLRQPPVAICNNTHGLGEAGETDRANAQYIVKAVNNHQALVDALDACAEYILETLDADDPAPRCVNVARGLIEQVKR